MMLALAHNTKLVLVIAALIAVVVPMILCSSGEEPDFNKIRFVCYIKDELILHKILKSTIMCR